MSSLAPKKIFTTHAPDGSVSIESSDSVDFVAMDPGNTLFAGDIFTTHTFPTVLDDEADIKRHKEWIASGAGGIGVRDGAQVVMNKFAPGAECPVHRTQTIDFGVVVEGELELVLPDGGTKLLKRGDVIIQRETYHGWRNPSKENETLVFFVALDAKPVKVGDETFGQDLSSLGM